LMSLETLIDGRKRGKKLSVYELEIFVFCNLSIPPQRG